MYKKDLALNNQQWLIYHKTKPNQTKPSDGLVLYPGHSAEIQSVYSTAPADCSGHPCRSTVVVLFNLYLGGIKGFMPFPSHWSSNSLTMISQFSMLDTTLWGVPPNT